MYRSLIVPVTIILSLGGCFYIPYQPDTCNEVNDTSTCEDEDAGRRVEGEDVQTTTYFVPGTSANDAIALFQQNDIVQTVLLRISYPDHESQIEVGGMSVEDTLKMIVDQQQTRLEFLLSQFNPEDPREVKVYKEIEHDLENLEATDALTIRYAVSETSPDISGATIIERQEFVQREKKVRPEMPSSARIVDWADDASFMPEYGISAIFLDGSFQKFWMDQDAIDAVDRWYNGVEIDTVIEPKYAVECGGPMDEADSNMPDWYKDTERVDGPEERNCSIGSISANQLQADELYWTWVPFTYFSPLEYPYVTIMYQPNIWCAWTSCKLQCRLDPAWCMCSTNAMPIQWLISYDYYDAPGQEVWWYKDTSSW